MPQNSWRHDRFLNGVKTYFAIFHHFLFLNWRHDRFLNGILCLTTHIKEEIGVNNRHFKRLYSRTEGLIHERYNTYRCAFRHQFI